jgi:quercetin dioxygenase-like cupin family protein
MDTNGNISVTRDGEGQSLSIAGGSYRILISGEQTGGNYAVIDMLIPPGGGPGPHAHKNIQEIFYVADGEVEFRTEDGKHIAKKGTLVNIPFGGKIHGFKNTSDTVAHLVCTVIPAGLDAFFSEIGTPVEAGTFLPPRVLSAEELNAFRAIGEKYGQVFYPPDFLD